MTDSFDIRTGLLRFSTAGSVDDGKSTLVGRLLFESDSIFEDQLQSIEYVSQQRGGGELNLALLTDGLRAEREQDITIDVAYRFFTTNKRKFIIADTPGHIQYTRNMITGASMADLTVVLVDVSRGITEQLRRHIFVSALLRIPHLVICVNKMDLVAYSQEAFEKLRDELEPFLVFLNVSNFTFIPVSALSGDNLTSHSRNMPWYHGEHLLSFLENVSVSTDWNAVGMRLPVQLVIRQGGVGHQSYRGYSGQMAGGVLRAGDEVLVLPSRQTTHIRTVSTFDKRIDEAVPPMSISVTLMDDLDVSRGDMLCQPTNLPNLGRELEVMLCWLADSPLRMGVKYLIKHTTRISQVVVDRLQYRLDVDSMNQEAADTLSLNGVGRCSIRTAMPLMYDSYEHSRTTGRFVMFDEVTNETVAAGIILGAT